MIRGIEPRGGSCRWIERFLRDKLEVKVEVKCCRRYGDIIVASLGIGK